MKANIFKRRGKFRVSREFIDHNPGLMKRIMGMVIVIQADPDMSRDAVVYYAYCDLFDECKSGIEVPEYEFTFKEAMWPDGTRIVHVSVKPHEKPVRWIRLD